MGELSCDAFGNYVIQEILACGLPRHQRQVADALLNGTLQVGCHWYGARIIQKALNSCSAEVFDAIAKKLRGNVCHVQHLMANEAGRLVLKSVWLSEQHSEKVLGRLQQGIRCTTKREKMFMTGEVTEYVDLL